MFFKEHEVSWHGIKKFQSSKATIANNTETYIWNLLRVDLKCSHHKNRYGDYMKWWKCWSTLWWSSYCNISMCQINILHTLNSHNIIWHKLEIELPYNPAIPLLGIHTKETRSERDTCTSMFIAALFIIARTWKQPRYPSADEWIRKLWYIYTMEYYSAIKIIHFNQF